MRSRMTSRFVFWIVCVLSLCQPAVAVDLRAFPEKERQAIDRRVLAGPDRRTEQPREAFYGWITGLGIARTPLSAEDEREMAKAEHRKVLGSFESSPAPESAQKVIDRLAKHLPAAAPADFEYSLTIIETPEYWAWTVGGGYLYLSRPVYETVTKHENHAEDRLAFVLAHEMGHIVRKHCRVRYQLLKLERIAKLDPVGKIEIIKLQRAIRRCIEHTGDKLEFLYEPQQEYEADLFAAHLCRNAGFDVQAGWDVLRQGVLTEDAGGDLHSDSAHALLSNDNAAEKKNRPTAADRLRQLCIDRDGIVRGAEFGLWEYHTGSDQWIKPRDLHITANEPVIVLVHGMDSSLTRCYIDLARALASDDAFRRHRILGFQYPGDASLSRMGTLLFHEVSRHFEPETKIDFVCHSAGGLVVRYYAEALGGSFQRIILEGTPNHGSDLARLRPVVEIKQFVKELREGYSEAVESVIRDGQEQIRHDLQPGSLFLNYLNDREVDRSRYAILRGNRFGTLGGLVFRESVELAQGMLIRKVASSDAPWLVRRETARSLRKLKKLQLPEEVMQGDLVVSTKSAKLAGVPDVRNFKLSHNELSRDPKTIAAAVEILKSPLRETKAPE